MKKDNWTYLPQGLILVKHQILMTIFQRNVEQVEARIASQIVGVNVKCSVRRKRLPSQQCCDKMVLCLKWQTSADP